MTPIVTALLSVLPEVLKSRQEFKDNLKRPGTLLSTIPAVAAAVAPEAAGMPPDSLEAALTQIALGVVALALFLIRR